MKKKGNHDLSNSQSQKKKVELVKVVNYNIDAANCDVISMMQYVPHGLHKLRNQSTAICQQIICVNIEVEYFSDKIIYHYPPSVYIFFVNTMHEI